MGILLVNELDFLGNFGFGVKRFEPSVMIMAMVALEKTLAGN